MLDPAVHDRIFAAVSHLPHLLAFGLVDLLAARPDAAELFRYAASGFRDFTRIAAGSPEMWRDISLANREALMREIDAYRGELDRIAAMVAAGRRQPRSKRCSRALRCAPRVGRPLRPGHRPSRPTGRAKPVAHGPRRERRPVATPSSTSRRCDAPKAWSRSRLEEHLQSHAAAGGALRRRHAPHGPARRRRRRSDAGRARDARASRSTHVPGTRDVVVHGQGGDDSRQVRATCISATPARRCARSPPCSRSPADTTKSRASPGCTSARSAISSTRCARWAPISAISATTGFPPLAIEPGQRPTRRARRSRDGARRRVEPVHVGAAHGAAAP